jgi:hypothetical protein
MHFRPVLLDSNIFSDSDKNGITALVAEKAANNKNYIDELHHREVGRWKALREYADKLVPVAREVFNDPTLMPTYNVYLKYGSDSHLSMHKDQNACVYTIDYCVSENVDWPLTVEGEEFSIPAGRAIAFMGGHDLHGRTSPPGISDALVENIMFHFCPADHWYFTEGPDYIKVLAERGELPSY